MNVNKSKNPDYLLGLIGFAVSMIGTNTAWQNVLQATPEDKKDAVVEMEAALNGCVAAFNKLKKDYDGGLPDLKVV